MTAAIQEHVRAWGEIDRETGAFLLKTYDSEVDMIGWPLVAGVVRNRGQFAVSGIALAQLFEWCSDQELQIAALLHSHKYEAFLSPVDLEYGFAAEGFLSTIVPDYATPSANPAEWGWWSFHDDTWNEVAPLEVVDRTFKGISFDEGGVSALEEGPSGLSPTQASLLAPTYLGKEPKR